MFPVPARLVDVVSLEFRSDLAPLENSSARSALANGLLLVGHPFVSRIEPAAAATARRRLETDAEPSWSVQRLRSELLVWQPPSRGRRHATWSSASCHARAHRMVNRTVWYHDEGAPVSCGALLHRGLAGETYAVIDLDADEAGREVCRSLSHGRQLMQWTGHVRSWIDAFTADQASSAHAMLRMSTHTSAYMMHFDDSENVLLQLAGTKRLVLAPPSQAPHAKIGAARSDVAIRPKDRTQGTSLPHSLSASPVPLCSDGTHFAPLITRARGMRATPLLIG